MRTRIHIAARAFLCLLIPVALLSQAESQPSLSYSVVSVRPLLPSDQHGVNRSGQDELAITQSLRQFVALAYGTRPEFVLDGPTWSDNQPFQIDAKVDPSEIAAFQALPSQQRDAMLQPILSSRFNLKFHRETRMLDVFNLVVARRGLGAEIHPHSPHRPNFDLGFSGDNLSGDGVQMSLFVVALSAAIRTTSHRPVLDKTGLTGEYDFLLRWNSSLDPAASEVPTRPGIFTAIQEQLGLKLEPAKEPVEVIVIDSATHPTED